MIYLAPFDVTSLSGTITFTQTASPFEAAVITVANLRSLDNQSPGVNSSILWHRDDQAFGVRSEDELQQLRHITYGANGMPTVLQLAVNTAWTGTPNITITYSHTTGRYTFTGNEAFSITFSSTTLRRLFGFTGNSPSATTHAAPRVPTYAIEADLAAVSADGGLSAALNYEPASIGNHPVADDGTGFGISRTVAPLYRDWVQQFETKAAVMREAQNFGTDDFWTYQAMREYCRGEWPFMVIGGFGETYDEVFSFRDEGIAWQPERASLANGTHFHVPFKTICDGRVVNP